MTTVEVFSGLVVWRNSCVFSRVQYGLQSSVCNRIRRWLRSNQERHSRRETNKGHENPKCSDPNSSAVNWQQKLPVRSSWRLHPRGQDSRCSSWSTRLFDVLLFVKCWFLLTWVRSRHRCCCGCCGDVSSVLHSSCD